MVDPGRRHHRPALAVGQRQRGHSLAGALLRRGGQRLRLFLRHRTRRARHPCLNVALRCGTGQHVGGLFARGGGTVREDVQRRLTGETALGLPPLIPAQGRRARGFRRGGDGVVDRRRVEHVGDRVRHRLAAGRQRPHDTTSRRPQGHAQQASAHHALGRVDGRVVLGGALLPKILRGRLVDELAAAFDQRGLRAARQGATGQGLAAGQDALCPDQARAGTDQRRDRHGRACGTGAQLVADGLLVQARARQFLRLRGQHQRVQRRLLHQFVGSARGVAAAHEAAQRRTGARRDLRGRCRRCGLGGTHARAKAGHELADAAHGQAHQRQRASGLRQGLHGVVGHVATDGRRLVPAALRGLHLSLEAGAALLDDVGLLVLAGLDDVLVDELAQAVARHDGTGDRADPAGDLVRGADDRVVGEAQQPAGLGLRDQVSERTGVAGGQVVEESHQTPIEERYRWAPLPKRSLA